MYDLVKKLLPNTFKHALKQRILRDMEQEQSFQEKTAPENKLVFIYQGRMGYYKGMGHVLYKNEPAFRNAIQKCHEVASQEFGYNVIELFENSEFDITKAQVFDYVIAQSCFQISLTDLWKAKGVLPQATIGMSLGELGAVYAADGLSFEEAMITGFGIAKVTQTIGSSGLWFVLKCSNKQAHQLCKNPFFNYISNQTPYSHTLFVLKANQQEATIYLEQNNITFSSSVADRAYHTIYADSIKDEPFPEFRRSLKLDYYSPTLNQVIPKGQMLPSRYWIDMLRKPVNFSGAFEKVLSDNYTVGLHIGAKPFLTNTVKGNALYHKKHFQQYATINLEGDETRVSTTLNELNNLSLVKKDISLLATKNDLAKSISPDTIDFYTPEVANNLYAYYEALRKQGPVHYLKKHHCWLILNYEDTTQILKNTQDFHQLSEKPVIDDFVFGEEGEIHDKHKGWAQSVFKHKPPIVEPLFLTETKKHLESLASKEPSNILNTLVNPLIHKFFGILLGLHPHEIRTLDIISTISMLYERLSVLGKYAELLIDIETEKQNTPKAYHRFGIVDDIWSKQTATSFLKMIFPAGTVTTQFLLGHLIHYYLKQKEKIDVNSLPLFIEEVLRLESPVQFLMRKTQREVVIQHHVIPKDALIAISTGAVNRDPLMFENPSEIMLNRKFNKHLAFGLGNHYCMGPMLSRLQVRIVLENFMTQFPNARLADSSKPSPYFPEMRFRYLQELNVVLG